MDFAGGTAVHITSGTAVLAFHVFYELDTKGFSRCWKGFWEIFMRHIKSPFVILGLVQEAPRLRIIRSGTNDNQDSDNNELEDLSPNRQGRKVRNSTNALGDPEAVTIPPIQDQPGLGLGAEADESPHNVNNMVLGTALLWIGWFGFNGGSALGGNLRAVSACVSTHVAACAGGTTSLLWFWMWSALAKTAAAEGEEEHKVPSVTHFCDGAVIGLVAITPAAGYVSHTSFSRSSQLTKC